MLKQNDPRAVRFVKLDDEHETMLNRMRDDDGLRESFQEKKDPFVSLREDEEENYDLANEILIPNMRVSVNVNNREKTKKRKYSKINNFIVTSAKESKPVPQVKLVICQKCSK